MSGKQKNSKTTSRSGFVLILMLVVLMITFIIGFNLMALGKRIQIVVIREMESIQARTAADSGLQDAIQGINNAVEDGTWSQDLLPLAENTPLPFLEAAFSYTTTYSSVDGYQIESVGTSKNHTHTVRAKLKWDSLFDYGIVSNRHLNIDAGALLDAYDSRISDNPADCSEKIVIGSLNVDDASVGVASGVIINGDVFCGPGNDPDDYIINRGGKITGERYALASSPTYPILTPPTIYGPDTSIEFSQTEKTIGPGGDYPATGRFEKISLGINSILRVTGDCTIHVAGRVNLGAKSQIIIENDASLKIYVDDGWISGTGCSVENLTGNPANLCVIQSKDQMIFMDIRAKNVFCGVIYAPQCGVEISTGSGFRGAVVSYWFNLNNSGRYLYDVALKDFSLGGGSACVIDRWDEN